MKKVGLWVLMFFVGLIGIPLSWMMYNHAPFNSVTNAFFNTSNTTLAFYILQWVIVILVTEVMLHSYEAKEVNVMKYCIIILLGAFVMMDYYLFYVVLATVLTLGYFIISRQRDQLKDDLTTIIEDVKEEYSNN